MASSPTLNRYRVLVYTWDAYKTYIDAASEEEALAKAEALYNEGLDAFDHTDDGVDEYVADLIGEAA